MRSCNERENNSGDSSKRLLGHGTASFFDPSVWSDRAVQDVFVDPAACGLLQKSIGIQEPCAAEQAAGSLHFHIDPVFSRLMAEDSYGEPVSELPCLPAGKHFVLIRCQCRGIAAFLQLLPMRQLGSVLEP